MSTRNRGMPVHRNLMPTPYITNRASVSLGHLWIEHSIPIGRYEQLIFVHVAAEQASDKEDRSKHLMKQTAKAGIAKSAARPSSTDCGTEDKGAPFDLPTWAPGTRSRLNMHGIYYTPQFGGVIVCVRCALVVEHPLGSHLSVSHEMRGPGTVKHLTNFFANTLLHLAIRATSGAEHPNGSHPRHLSHKGMQLPHMRGRRWAPGYAPETHGNGQLHEGCPANVNPQDTPLWKQSFASA